MSKPQLDLVLDETFDERAGPVRPGAVLDHVCRGSYGPLVSFLRRRGVSRDDAADLAQDAFERVSGMELAKIDNPRAFLFTTALNLVRDRARSARVRYDGGGLALHEARLDCAAPGPERVLIAKQQLALLNQALESLSPKCRAVFVLHRFDDLSQKDIANRLGISVSMVEKYVRQALQQCRDYLAQANGDDRPTVGKAAARDE